MARDVDTKIERSTLVSSLAQSLGFPKVDRSSNFEGRLIWAASVREGLSKRSQSNWFEPLASCYHLFIILGKHLFELQSCCWNTSNPFRGASIGISISISLSIFLSLDPSILSTHSPYTVNSNSSWIEYVTQFSWIFAECWTDLQLRANFRRQQLDSVEPWIRFTCDCEFQDDATLSL